MSPIEEAIALEDADFCRSAGEGSWQRLEQIWAELTAPYRHLYPEKVGFDSVGAGWWADILDAFAKISALMVSAPDYKFNVLQIKEKFGGIRLYFSVQRADGVRAEEDETRDYLFSQALLIVRELEVNVYQKCEICGKHGKQRHTGWIKTLCDSHDAIRSAYLEREESK